MGSPRLLEMNPGVEALGDLDQLELGGVRLGAHLSEPLLVEPVQLHLALGELRPLELHLGLAVSERPLKVGHCGLHRHALVLDLVLVLQLVLRGPMQPLLVLLGRGLHQAHPRLAWPARGARAHGGTHKGESRV